MRSSSSRAGVFGEPVGQAVLLELIEHVAAAGKIAHQHALPVAHRFRRDVLVGRRILQHRAHVHAALVGERAVADVGLIVAQRQVGQLGDEARHRGQARQLLRPDGGVAQLQLQVGDDRAQIGVAAALAIAVHAALHVRGALLHGRERIGHGHIGIVMRMDADARRRTACAHPRRSRPAGR